MKYLPMLIIAIILFIAGCSAPQTTIVSEPIEIPSCPETCDDGDDNTIDSCSEATGFLCEHTKISVEDELENLKESLNSALGLDYKYTAAKTDDSTMVTHHTSDIEPQDAGRIVIDVLDYEITSEEIWRQYISSQQKDFFMADIARQREAFGEYLSTKDYYFDGSPHRIYENHSYDEHIILDNHTSGESVFGSVDIYTIHVRRTQKSDPTTKMKFYFAIAMAQRVSVQCSPSTVVHVYAEEPEYIQVDMSSVLLRATESSYILRSANENREDLLEMAEKVEEVCNTI